MPFNRALPQLPPFPLSMVPPTNTVTNTENVPPKPLDLNVKARPKASAGVRALKRRGAVSDLLQSLPKKQRGRVVGAANYLPEDVDALLNILEEQLPLGGKGWLVAADSFFKWAEENGRPFRSAKSLELKFKQVCCVTYTCIAPYDLLFTACPD